jgi:hypothetical protein
MIFRMRTIINGSRTIFDYEMVRSAIELSGIIPTQVISGTAPGVDRLGERWAMENNIELIRMPADWDTLGKKAGYVRNVQMVDVADSIISVWDGKSVGTKHTFRLAAEKGLRVFVYCCPR